MLCFKTATGNAQMLVRAHAAHAALAAPGAQAKAHGKSIRDHVFHALGRFVGTVNRNVKHYNF